MKSKHQIAVIPQIKSIIDEARILKIRLLIEIELSGKLWIYCDQHHKRTILKLIRQYKVRNPKHISAGGYDTRFQDIYPTYKVLGFDKGKNVQKLHHQRSLEYDTIGDKQVYYFDCTEAQRDFGKRAIRGTSRTDIAEIINKERLEMTANFDGDNVILFYGK